MCAQRAQTSAKASNLNHKWSGIGIRICGLIRILIGMFTAAETLWIHYGVGVSHFAMSVAKKTAGDCMRNATSNVLYSAMVRVVEK